MSKEQSTILKGIAILMMLWYHLFGIAELEDVCTPLIHIHQKALVAYLANTSYPVSFFMILSGYGLTYLFRKNSLNVKGQFRRILKLFIYYWIILLIFVSIGHFINPEVYPNDLIHVVANIIGIRCTYNGETWFLLPYSLIALSSFWIIKYVYHLNDRKKIALTLVIYAIVFLATRHLSNNLPENTIWITLLMQPVYYVQLSVYFCLGIILYRLVERNMLFSGHRTSLYGILLVCLIILKSMFKITIADGLYALAFIILCLNIPLNKYVAKVLHSLGQYSMPMWMTHTFFAVYLFPQFFYGMKYPVLIFVSLVITTYITAIPIMMIGKKVSKMLGL